MSPYRKPPEPPAGDIVCVYCGKQTPARLKWCIYCNTDRDGEGTRGCPYCARTLKHGLCYTPGCRGTDWQED